jgi:hypothetical protein
MSVSATDRGAQRHESTKQLPTALERVAWRPCAPSAPSEDADRYAEVVTTKVKHQTEVACGALRGRPPIVAR